MASAPAPLRPVPGPPGLPLLGNLPEFGKDPQAFFVRLREEFGDCVTWSLGRRRCLLVSHPTHIAELFRSVGHGYETTFLTWPIKQTLGNSVLLSHGSDWRRKRGLVQPVLRPRQVRGYAPRMIECATALADRWHGGERIDVQREMAELTQRVVLRTLFGDDLGPSARVLGDAMAVGQRQVAAELRGFGLFLPPWARTPGRLRLLGAVRVLDAEIHRLVGARRAELESGAPPRDDVVSRLLAARDEDGRALTDVEVRDEAATLWIGGHETTSTLLTWTWYLLSAHPHSREHLDEELDRVLGGRPPAVGDYERLDWTRHIIQEALRLYPPAWAVKVTAQPGATLGGTAIRAGTLVWCSMWAAHRDPRWYPEPDAFRPQRWRADAPDAERDRVWFPFGGGQRACLGARFAQVEAALVLATLAQRFTLNCEPGEPGGPAQPATRTGALLQPARPLHATLTART
ncbi:cytochrome P450 [Streptomyces spectabilis]|uniref:Cytochrome P450 n=1 Tax=Streptomyces spectabilis TaxID=68270 RepID=A0A516RK93_STRST|nr:cytochrome P450 [Streptomyces spectabilis]QDQ16071.1 cytochrome P450 [Streptomyces spectabilis]